MNTSRQSEHRTIWIADDDAGTRAYLSTFLASRGYGVACMDSGEQVVRRLAAQEQPSLLLLDMRMPHLGGLEVLGEMEKRGWSVPFIVLSAVDQISTVVKAMRHGAQDYLLKPIDEKELEAAVAKAIAQQSPMNGATVEGAFQSSNRRMAQVRAICDQVAPTDVPVLILGESGVGKEVAAKYIHAKSDRRHQFVKVNCAALPSELLESELFGHERGAFTGADREKPGKFELAGAGTIMLDEVAEMSPLLQAKLLHVLQDGEYSRLGGTRSLKSEARVIAATNKRLHRLVTQGGFREDLYFRINVITIEIPPLRDRSEDIPALCERFVAQYRGKYNSQVSQLPRELLTAFVHYSWPGNIRQLENAVRRFLIIPDLERAMSELSEPDDSPPDVHVSPSKMALKVAAADAASKVERELVLQTLNEVSWNRKKAAQRLGICYKSLLNKLQRWNLSKQANGEAQH